MRRMTQKFRQIQVFFYDDLCIDLVFRVLPKGESFELQNQYFGETIEVQLSGAFLEGYLTISNVPLHFEQ